MLNIRSQGYLFKPVSETDFFEKLFGLPAVDKAKAMASPCLDAEDVSKFGKAFKEDLFTKYAAHRWLGEIAAKESPTASASERDIAKNPLEEVSKALEQSRKVTSLVLEDVDRIKDPASQRLALQRIFPDVNSLCQARATLKACFLSAEEEVASSMLISLVDALKTLGALLRHFSTSATQLRELAKIEAKLEQVTTDLSTSLKEFGYTPRSPAAVYHAFYINSCDLGVVGILVMLGLPLAYPVYLLLEFFAERTDPSDLILQQLEGINEAHKAHRQHLICLSGLRRELM